jgi:hypothetical protein
MLSICQLGSPGTLEDMNKNLYQDPHSLKNYWRDISFGRAYFNETTSLIKYVSIPCSAFPTPGSCKFDDWVTYIENNAAKLGVPELRAFNYKKVFVTRADCGAAGFQAGPIVYVDSDYLGLGIFTHELGHSKGLSHSSVWDSSKPDGQRNEEYGDPSTPMGNCEKCSYVAPHLIQLGWAQPVATMTSADLPLGQWSRPIDLPPLVDSPVSTLVVLIDWDRNPKQAGASNRPLGAFPSVYASYRVAKKQDIDLAERFDRAVSIHSVGDGGGNTYLESALKPGNTWSDANFGMAIRVEASSSSNVATVRVCKFTNRSPTTCS